MKVIKNYLYNAGYQLLAIILPLITAPYVSRTLRPEGVGVYSYTNSLIQWFTIFAILGIDLYGQKQIATVRDDKKRLSDTFWEIQITKTIFTVASFLLLYFFLLIYTKYTFYMWLQSLNIVAALLDISWLYMGLENFKITVIRNTIVKIASLILIFAFVKNSSDLGLYIFITGIAIVIGNMTLWPYLGGVLVKINFRQINPFKHFIPTLAYFIPQNATQIYLIVNKNMLGFMDTATASGFYNNTDNLVRVVLVFVTSVGTVMMPYVANEFSKGNLRNIKKYTYLSFKFVSVLSFAMAFGLASISLKGAIFFYGSGYEPVGLALPVESIIIILLGWSNTLGTQYLVPTNRVNKYTASVVMGTVFNIVLNIPCILVGGLYGAMLSTVISEIIVVCYQFFIVRNELNFHELFKNNFKYLISGLIMFIIVFTMDIKMPGNFVSIVIQILAGVVVYLLMLWILKVDLVDILMSKVKNEKDKDNSF